MQPETKTDIVHFGPWKISKEVIEFAIQNPWLLVLAVIIILFILSRAEIFKALGVFLQRRSTYLSELESYLESSFVKEIDMLPHTQEEYKKEIFQATTGIDTDRSTREALLKLANDLPHFTWPQIRIAWRDFLAFEPKSNLLTPVPWRVYTQRLLLISAYACLALLTLLLIASMFTGLVFVAYYARATLNGWENNYVAQAVPCFVLAIFLGFIAHIAAKHLRNERHAHRIIKELRSTAAKKEEP
ncbi:hypothetical protein [Pseudoteredinibacter isoporae]|uniref:hypothetical protein n=1 Tax=Pseudoteredinibacter isoporae TaxID=570281 RepID=UPI0031078FCF